MKNKIFKHILYVIIFSTAFVLFTIKIPTVVEAISKYGSRGEEVTQIQTKLKNWGYYFGEVDGIFGSKTQNAVKLFQQRNGLAVDGIAGLQTLRAMGIATSSTSSSSNKVSSIPEITRPMVSNTAVPTNSVLVH